MQLQETPTQAYTGLNTTLFFNTLPLPGTASGDMIRANDSLMQQNPLSILRLLLMTTILHPS